jgi:hypothetical protein
MGLRIALIGPGDINFHFIELLKLPQEELNKNIFEISEALKQNKAEIVIVPDKGICFEIAKKYREFGGKKVIGSVPVSDTYFGIKHLLPCMETKIEGKKLIDEIIDTKTWYQQDATHCLYGDCVLLLGKSLGSIGELSLGFYISKILAKKENLAKKIRAGRVIPFTAIIYNPFVKGQSSFEMEAYIKKSGGRCFYVNNAGELKELLTKLTKEYNFKKR